MSSYSNQSKKVLIEHLLGVKLISALIFSVHSFRGTKTNPRLYGIRSLVWCCSVSCRENRLTTFRVEDDNKFNFGCNFWCKHKNGVSLSKRIFREVIGFLRIGFAFRKQIFLSPWEGCPWKYCSSPFEGETRGGSRSKIGKRGGVGFPLIWLEGYTEK